MNYLYLKKVFELNGKFCLILEWSENVKKLNYIKTPFNKAIKTLGWKIKCSKTRISILTVWWSNFYVFLQPVNEQVSTVSILYTSELYRISSKV